MRIDHLVWYCPDLARGEADFARWTQCRPAYGGVHPGEGTRNSLLSLGDETYVEILAPDPGQAAALCDSELRGLAGAGLYHWAVGGSELADIRAKATAARLEVSDIVSGGRVRPDGKALSWNLVGLRNHRFGALVPFFIDWMASEHPARTAPRGGNILRIEASSPEPEALADIYRILGIDIAVAGAATAGLSATIASPGGEQTLRMFDPVPRGFVI